MSPSATPSHSFSPEDFYRLAGDLYNDLEVNDAEAIKRTIVGRSYYAAFLAARNASGILSTSKSVHNMVVDYWKRHGKISVSNRLQELKAKREDADYVTNRAVNSRDAQRALGLCKKILAEIS